MIWVSVCTLVFVFLFLKVTGGAHPPPAGHTHTLVLGFSGLFTRVGLLSHGSEAVVKRAHCQCMAVGPLASFAVSGCVASTGSVCAHVLNLWRCLL